MKAAVHDRFGDPANVLEAREVDPELSFLARPLCQAHLLLGRTKPKAKKKAPAKKKATAKKTTARKKTTRTSRAATSATQQEM